MKLKSLIFILVALLLGGILGIGGTIGAQKFIFQSSEGSSVNEVIVAKKTGPLLPIGEFTVNLQGGAFLKTSITVQVVNAKALDQLKEEDAFLKDRVIAVLSSKSLEDVQKPEVREKLRKELIDQLNEVAGNRIIDVLFQSFVYQ